jgi:hypothetical protein
MSNAAPRACSSLSGEPGALSSPPARLVLVPAAELEVVLEHFRRANWPDTKAGNAAYAVAGAIENGVEVCERIAQLEQDLERLRGVKCWYKLFEFLARNGRRYIVGSFGRWAGNDPGAFKVEQSFEGMHADEVERFRRSQAELEAKAEAARRDKAERAANRAKQQYEAARASGSSPYLERKGFAPAEKGALPAGLRVFADGTLLVPMMRYDVTEEQLADPSTRARASCAACRRSRRTARSSSTRAWRRRAAHSGSAPSRRTASRS